MSDAQLYRSKDEVEEYKKLILLPSFRLNKRSKYATEEEITAIEKEKARVQECVDFAEESDYPPVQQLYDVVYEQENYPFIPHKL
jgi:pyruvate dehydrogenase E1 component alpha subunit